jgi:hypothetical protein
MVHDLVQLLELLEVPVIADMMISSNGVLREILVTLALHEATAAASNHMTFV